MEVRVAPGGLIKGPMSLSEFSTMSRKAETLRLPLRALLDKRLSITDSSSCGEAEAETKSNPGPPSGCKPAQVSLNGLDTYLNTMLEFKVVSNYWPFLINLCFNFPLQKYLKHVISIQVCWILTSCELQTDFLHLLRKNLHYVKYLWKQFWKRKARRMNKEMFYIHNGVWRECFGCIFTSLWLFIVKTSHFNAEERKLCFIKCVSWRWLWSKLWWPILMNMFWLHI